MNDRAGGQQDGPAAGSEAVSGPSGRPLVGVLGGLGPAATLDLYAKIVALTPASTDQEHIRLLIDADPEVPDRNRSVAGAGPSSAPALIAKARRLAAAGAELLVLACNAAHAYQADIVAAVDLPFIGIVDEAVQAAAQLAPSATTFGLLATTGTLDAGLYQRALAATGRRSVELTGPDRDRFMEVIYRVKAADTGPQTRSALRVLAATLVSEGAQVLIAACTEVPLLFSEVEARELGVPLVDATAALARAVVAAGAGRRGTRGVAPEPPSTGA